MNLMMKIMFVAIIGFMSQLSKAQMPVTVTSDVTAALNQIAILDQWALQYQQMVTELEHLKQTYEAITGNGAYGLLAFSPELVQYLPAEWQGIYDKVKDQEFAGLKNIAKKIMEKEGFNPKLTGGIKRYQETLAANKAMATEAYNSTRQRLANINTLMQKTNLTLNTKQAADMQNRIAAENAIIQNEQTRINLMLKLQEIELKLAEEQKEREFKDKFYR